MIHCVSDHSSSPFCSCPRLPSFGSQLRGNGWKMLRFCIHLELDNCQAVHELKISAWSAGLDVPIMSPMSLHLCFKVTLAFSLLGRCENQNVKRFVHFLKEQPLRSHFLAIIFSCLLFPRVGSKTQQNLV